MVAIRAVIDGFELYMGHNIHMFDLYLQTII